MSGAARTWNPCRSEIGAWKAISTAAAIFLEMNATGVTG